jgi:hypothetical protein
MRGDWEMGDREKGVEPGTWNLKPNIKSFIFHKYDRKSVFFNITDCDFRT